MPSRPFVLSERIRWADVDLVGIMRYSAVTRFVELAEQELHRAAGIPYETWFIAPEIWMPRRHLSVDFLAPARIDDPITLVTYVSRLGTTSLTLNVDLRHADGSLVAAAAVVVVCVTAAEFTKQPLPQALREALAPFACSVEEARSTPVR